MKRITFLHAIFFAISVLAADRAAGQIEFKLHWMEEDQVWGVFARPEAGLEISLYTIIGSGQITVVTPVGSSFMDLTSVSGNWVQNAYISSPDENPGMDYISFGLNSNDPPIQLVDGEETLLLTFAPRDGVCPDTVYLISNDDPLNVFPNSANANPGNDISILDVRRGQFIYNFTNVYDPEAWNCHPGKTVPLGPYREPGVRRQKKEARP